MRMHTHTSTPHIHSSLSHILSSVHNQGGYWTPSEATAFGVAIKDHNVIALVHGHTHVCVFYTFDMRAVTGRQYPVFNAPALQKVCVHGCALF